MSRESHVCLVQPGVWSRWSRSRSLRYDGVGVEIFFVTLTLILIICELFKMKINNLHRIAYILSYGASVINLNLQLSKH